MNPSYRITQRARLLAASLALAFTGCAIAETNAPPAFLTVVTAHFAAWDRNHDGILATDELDALVADPRVAKQEAAAVAALKRASRSRTIKLPPLTLESIPALATNKPAAGSPDLARMYREGMTRLGNATHRELFASGLPKLETIHQGKLGNCFCLAPLGAMVHRNPKQVADMFTAQGDGTYRVQLGKQAVLVTPPTDAELAMTASNEQDGIWVNLYEKAVGQARNEARPPAERAGSALDALARGGSAGTMLALITGHEITRFSFKFAKDPAVAGKEREAKLKELSEQLAAAAAARRLMTCGTLKTTTPGLTPNHAYAVLDYSAKTDAVTLWNPHGGKFSPKGDPGLKNGYPEKDGVFELPVRDIVQEFSGMAFEVPEAPLHENPIRP